MKRVHPSVKMTPIIFPAIAFCLIIITILSARSVEGGGKDACTVEVSGIKNGGIIPMEYTCDGKDVSPKITWTCNTIENEDPDLGSYALILYDSDARDFIHWLVYDIPSTMTTVGDSTSLPTDIKETINDFGSMGYGGPCPPDGQNHHYHFHIYALDNTTSLSSGGGSVMTRMTSKSSFEALIKNHVLAQGELVATYQRSDTEGERHRRIYLRA